MKSVILMLAGAVIGALTFYYLSPRVEENVDDGFAPLSVANYTYRTGDTIPEDSVKIIYKRYIKNKVRKNKYSKKRFGSKFLNNKDKQRYIDLDSDVIKGLLTVQSEMDSINPASIGLRLFIGIQKQTVSDTDYIYMASYLKPSGTAAASLLSKYYVIDVNEKNSPTCPIECDNRDYENPF
jgi:hypothetical protein